MESKKVTIFAPATIANFGPGFDVFGAALESVGDIITAETLGNGKGDVIIKSVIGDVPKEADKNSAGIGVVGGVSPNESGDRSCPGVPVLGITIS